LQSRVITSIARYPRDVPEPVESRDPELGTVIADRYRIVELLGEGGMGAVYKAEHLQLAKMVAIKLLRPEISSRKDADARFQREAMAGARLQHPNVVGVLDFGTRDDGGMFLVMELLQGDSLRDLLDRETRLPWPRAVHIARQVLRGLAHAHDQGVIHRDIKPENIHLSHDGEDPDVAKLIDFGIAMLIAGEGADVRLTAAGLAVGTPTYLAPEQAVGGKLGEPTDLYSLSVVLYEMLAGRPPFVSDEPVRLLTAHAMTSPPTFGEVAPEASVPGAIEAVVMRGLAKTWSERITSAADYIAALDEARRAAGLNIASTGAIRLPTPLPIPPAGTPPVGVPTSTAPAPAVPAADTASSARVLPMAAPALVAPPPPAPAPPAPAPMPPPVTTEQVATAGWRPTKKQLQVIGGVLAVVVVIAIIAALAGGGASSGRSGTHVAPVPVMVPSPADRENAMKAAILDLTDGKTCELRRKAVAKLRSLGDVRAIPALKKARYRMRGGVLGIGDSNTNNCLRKDAEAAILALGGDPSK
jgi:tRNA A-37 threonylcarbamoyl transferase component Bud32